MPWPPPMHWVASAYLPPSRCRTAAALPVMRAPVAPSGWPSAIALGHPLGATGARIVGKAASLLTRVGGRFALATQCIGGGQGIATILERI